MSLADLLNITLPAILSSELNNNQEQTRSLHPLQAWNSLEVSWTCVLITPLTKPILFLADKVSYIKLSQLVNPSPLNLKLTSWSELASDGWM